MPRWDECKPVPRGTSYDDRFSGAPAVGGTLHGEANFASAYQPRTVYDAGCGGGRIAIELANRGVDTVGVDLDERTLESAQRRAPHLRWFLGDISCCDVIDDAGERELFDVVIAAGNVMIFLEPGTEAEAVATLAEHLVDGGLLITGFQIRPGQYSPDLLDADCGRAGLECTERYSTWHRDAFNDASPYVVSVHRRPRSRRFVP